MLLIIRIEDDGIRTDIRMLSGRESGDDGSDPEVLTDRQKMVADRLRNVIRGELETIQAELLANNELKSVIHIVRDPP